MPKKKKNYLFSFIKFIYKELFSYKHYHVLFVEDHNQLNLFQNDHQEIDEDLLLNLLTRKKTNHFNSH